MVLELHELLSVPLCDLCDLRREITVDLCVILGDAVHANELLLGIAEFLAEINHLQFDRELKFLLEIPNVVEDDVPSLLEHRQSLLRLLLPLQQASLLEEALRKF